jgi:hypothetical protein
MKVKNRLEAMKHKIRLSFIKTKLSLRLQPKYKALALLPADMVVPGFNILKDEAHDHPKFRSFIAFIQRWIFKVTDIYKYILSFQFLSTKI